jgi:hypothetical protein
MPDMGAAHKSPADLRTWLEITRYHRAIARPTTPFDPLVTAPVGYPGSPATFENRLRSVMPDPARRPWSVLGGPCWSSTRLTKAETFTLIFRIV